MDVDDGSFVEFVNVLRVGSPAGCGGGERAEWSCCHAVFFLPCLSLIVCAPLVHASVSRLYGITCSVACPGGRSRVRVGGLPFWCVDDGERAVAAVNVTVGDGDGAVARVAAPRVVYVFGECDGLGIAWREDSDGTRGEIA